MGSEDQTLAIQSIDDTIAIKEKEKKRSIVWNLPEDDKTTIE